MTRTHYLSVLILACVPLLHANVTPTYKIRSQSRDKTRQVVGTTEFTHRFDMETWYGEFSMMPVFTDSFRTSDICQSLFGDSVSATPVYDSCGRCTVDCNSPTDHCTIQIQGSSVANRSAKAWFADYFYLPRDFNGTISFRPNIKNFLFDLDLFVGLDEWMNGFYLRFYGPITYTRWNLNFCENTIVSGDEDYPAGYFNAGGIPNGNLLNYFGQFAAGGVLAQPLGDTTVYNPLLYAKMAACPQSAAGFADLRFEAGWNAWQNDNYHAGINFQVAAPTGTRYDPEFLFSPIIGNGAHWEVGAGFTGHYVAWRSVDEEKVFSVHTDLSFTHLCKRKYNRTFDLKDKPLSRYMLAQRLSTNNQFLRGDSTTGTLSTLQFAQEFAPVANLSTVEVDVSIGMQADLVFMAHLTSGNFSWDFGYNFWGHTCEDISCVKNDCSPRCAPLPNSLCSLCQEQSWALKGDARVYGFATANSTTPPFALNDAVPLSVTQSGATIYSGTSDNTLNGTPATSGPLQDRNVNSDNPQLAFAGTPSAALNNVVGGTQIFTSIQPVLITCESINFQGVRGISNKIFGHLSYAWDREDWIPFLGFGAFAEFGVNSHSCCTTTTTAALSCDAACKKCINSALSEWGVWIKGGISFS